MAADMRTLSIWLLGATVLVGAACAADAEPTSKPTAVAPAKPASAAPASTPVSEPTTLAAPSRGAQADPAKSAAAPAQVAQADPAKPAGAKADCTKAGVRKARAVADAAVKAKDHAKAIATLEPVLRGCGTDTAELGWVASDLAVAYEKSGDPIKCQRLLAPLVDPKSGLQDASDKLLKAIQFNLDRCSKAFDGKHAALKTGGCTLSVDHAIATVAAPPALAPKGATAACVALVKGKAPPPSPDDDPDVRDVVCPVLALVWKSGAKVERRELAVTDGPVTDDSVCCNLSSLAAGTVDGKPRLRVRGSGLDCNGGTADATSDVVLDWDGKSLRLAANASVTNH